MLWFTSDLHLMHSNIITIGEGRPFDDITRMENYLIDAINDRVSTADELWILGDFVMRGNPTKVRPFRERIFCPNVHLVRGNHDKRYRQTEESADIFQSVSDYKEIGRPSKDGFRAVLFHYPVMDWDRMYHGSYMLHGHIHSMPAKNGAPARAPFTSAHEHGYAGYNEWNRANGFRRYDVGVDANGYAPVCWDEIERFFDGMELARKEKR